MDEPVAQPPPSESAPPEPAGAVARGPNRVRRLIALALLGSAIALAVVQVTKAIKHDIRIQVQLAEATAAELTRLELGVWEEDQAGSPAVLTVFRFDADHRPPAPVEHIFTLPNGRYDLRIKLYTSSDPNPVRIHKPLEVSGEATTRYRLP